MKELLIKFNILMSQSDQAECGIDADKLLLQSLETLLELCESNIEEHKDHDKTVMTLAFKRFCPAHEVVAEMRSISVLKAAASDCKLALSSVLLVSLAA